MKKRLVSLVICFAIVFTMLPLSAFAATTISSLDEIVFSIPISIMRSDGSVDKTTLKAFKDVSSTSSSYKMVFCLPDNATPDNLYISWTPAECVSSVKYNNKTYSSGTIAIPNIDSTISLSVTASVVTYGRTSSKSATFQFSVIKERSQSVKSLYIDVDETKGTVKAMNEDINHETSCFGTFEFDGKSYYVEIKGRGNYTWKQSKKPYNITVYENSDYGDKLSVSLIDGVESKKYSLLANYADSTLLRNKIGYDLAESLGIGLKSRYVDLWLNGEFLGNYLFTPKTDYDASKNGYMLELDNKKEPTGVDEKGNPIGDPQFMLTGLDTITDGENVYNMLTIKDIGKKSGADEASIQSWMQTALNAILNTSTTEYLQYIDIDSWAKMYLLQEFYKNYDIIAGSQFMYRNGTGDSDKLFAGPVWDLDNALGREQNCGSNTISSQMQHSGGGWYIDSINTTKVKSFLQLLGKHSDFMERVYQIYNEYKASFENVSGNIDVQKADIETSRNINFKRWNVNQTQYNVSYLSSGKTYSLNTSDNYSVTYIATKNYDNYITNLKTYVNTRLKFFSDMLTVTAPTCTVSGEMIKSVGDTFTLTANASNVSSYQWQSSTKGKVWDNIPDANSNIYSVQVTEDMDKLMYRCAVKKTGNTISTTNVPTVATSALGYGVADSSLHVHIYKNKVTLPTCTKEGYTTHTCSCGKSYVDTPTPVIPHSFDEGKCVSCGKYQDINSVLLHKGQQLKLYDIRNLLNAKVIFSFDYYLDNTGDLPTIGNIGATLLSGKHTFIYSGKITGAFIPTITSNCLSKIYFWNISLNVNGVDVPLENLLENNSDIQIENETYDLLPNVCGDVNNDGVCDLRDLVHLKNYFANGTVNVDLFKTDLDNDSYITVNDLAMLKIYLLNQF